MDAVTGLKGHELATWKSVAKINDKTKENAISTPDIDIFVCRK